MAPAMAAIIEMSSALLKSLSINIEGPWGETFLKICYKISFPRVFFRTTTTKSCLGTFKGSDPYDAKYQIYFRPSNDELSIGFKIMTN